MPPRAFPSDDSRAMYEPGEFISLALDFLGKSGQPNALAPGRGLSPRERLRLQQFVAGMKVTTPCLACHPDRHRVVKRVTPESARSRTFKIDGVETMTVMEYFQNQMNIPLQHPDLICVELASGAVVPVELCKVPPGQLVRRQMSPDHIGSILAFSGLPSRHHEGLGVLQYGQSQYVQQFGIDVPNPPQLLEVDA